jgi:molecular chaperone DnaJ
MDLYSLLGLSRTASSAEIERAYRRLARRYHPGVNPGDRVSEQAYRQIQQAYEVLTDRERRREYDRAGVAAAPAPEAGVASIAFEGFDFSSAADGPLAATFSELFSDVFRRAAEGATTSPRGADINLAVRVSFADAIRGVDVPLSLTRQVWCAACAGSGHHVRAAVPCPSCQGQGQQRWARGHMLFTKACEACGGGGQLTTQACRSCRGAGAGTRTEVVTVRVPAGVDSGTRISVPGRGHAGAPGAPAGDLYVQIDVDEHRYFRRHGRDLVVTVPLGVHEAALGAVVEVPTVYGSVSVRVPPGTTSGQQLRVAGEGLRNPVSAEAAGDLLVEIQLVVPVSLDERSTAILREFGRLNDLAPTRRAFFESGHPPASPSPAK